jgi:uncharacterized protein
MEYLFVILGVICMLVGIIGSILPGLPGPPISFLGLLLFHWSRFADFSFRVLFIWAMIVLIVAILDYVVPVWGTRKFGGTKAGVVGSTIGLIVGVILLPVMGIVLGPMGLIGILGGPFLGALVGEITAGHDTHKAIRAAFGSFVGFVAGTIMKIAVSVVLAFYSFTIMLHSLF